MRRRSIRPHSYILCPQFTLRVGLSCINRRQKPNQCGSVLQAVAYLAIIQSGNLDSAQQTSQLIRIHVYVKGPSSIYIPSLTIELVPLAFELHISSLSPLLSFIILSPTTTPKTPHLSDNPTSTMSLADYGSALPELFTEDIAIHQGGKTTV